MRLFNPVQSQYSQVIKPALLVLIALFMAAAAVAQTTELPLRQAIAESDYESVNLLLQTSLPDESAAFEEIITEAARQALFANDFDKASRLAEIVLLFNLDNITAQDIYTGVEDARRQQAALEERKQLAEVEELERQRLAEQQRRRDEVRELFARNLSYSIGLAPAGGSLAVSDFVRTLSEYNREEYQPGYGYGIGLAAGLRFQLPELRLRLDADLFWHPPLLIERWRLDWQASLYLGAPRFTGLLALHLGYQQLRLLESTTQPVLLYHTVSTPLLGLGIDHWWLSEKLALSAIVDWKLVSATDPVLDLAMQGLLGLRMPLIRFAGYRNLFVDFLIRADLALIGLESTDPAMEWLVHGGVFFTLTLNDYLEQ